MKTNQSGFTLIQGFLVAILVVGLGVGGWYMWSQKQSDDTNSSRTQSGQLLSEEEMLVEYRCNRITADYLATDVYCNDYELYVEDFKNGTLVSEYSSAEASESEPYKILLDGVSHETAASEGACVELGNSCNAVYIVKLKEPVKDDFLRVLKNINQNGWLDGDGRRLN